MTNFPSGTDFTDFRRNDIVKMNKSKTLLATIQHNDSCCLSGVAFDCKMYLMVVVVCNWVSIVEC
jgi:hypothetical protein